MTLSYNPLGIKNIGNSCYINSSLQMLFVIPGISELIDEKKDEPVVEHLFAILYTQDRSQERLRLLRQSVFFKNPTEFPQDQLTDQHDAHAFLVELLDHLEWKPFQTFSKFRPLDKQYQGNRSPLEKATNHISITPIKGASFQSSLDNYFAFEEMEGERKFSHVKTRKLASMKFKKALRIKAPPPFLIVQMKIFDDSGNKCNFPVEFSEKDIIFLNQGKKQTRYACAGSLTHEGETLEQGHYRACVKSSKSNSWYLCDDDKIKEAQPQDLTKGAYVIVLQRIDTI